MTLPANTEALAATTPADAFTKSEYKCDGGDDAPCVTIYGAGACCFEATVKTAGADANTNLAASMIGWPTEADQSGKFCLDGLTKAGITALQVLGDDGENTTWPNAVNGGQYQGYCVSAMKVAASLTAAAAAVFANAF